MIATLSYICDYTPGPPGRDTSASPLRTPAPIWMYITPLPFGRWYRAAEASRRTVNKPLRVVPTRSFKVEAHGKKGKKAEQVAKGVFQSFAAHIGGQGKDMCVDLCCEAEAPRATEQAAISFAREKEKIR
ncbi:uncharacterized protein CLUP02_10860 [Colletotrichum lupini]|uniref:Uncharacterized protein n=1 Tax=Colletotrichum lupini TaxID=145971 RepID=A0A9Q8SXJ8_9PEZI|nr:uncharacterized protein CLUP02_10860 [Colletotrichum lupini]UQC85363.1 hypothetical protein CLUP02_10860 [Colletotrichum lupini]